MKKAIRSICTLPLSLWLGISWAALPTVSTASQSEAARRGVMLGVYVSGSQDNLTSLEKQIGRRLAIDFAYQNWDWRDGLSRQAWDIQQGRTPLIAWSSNIIRGESCATASDIAAGKYDTQLKSQAKAVKSLGAKVFIEFIPEMTDRKSIMDCFYGAGWSLSDSQVAHAGNAYIAAQHRVVGIFRAAGAAKVEWVFAPDAGAYGKGNGGLGEWVLFYPGAAWVDWIGVDHHVGPHKIKTFPDPVLEKFYRKTLSYGKPLMIAQTTALADPNGHPDAQTLWLSSALAAIPSRYPAIHAFIFNDHGNQDKGGDTGKYMLQGTGLATFKAMANDPNFSAR